MPSFAQEGIPLFLFLLVVVFFRAQGTYWLGRALTHGVIKAQDREGFMGRVARWFNGPVPRKGAALLDRWGLIIIPLCFLTVGVQTAVNAGAGVVRLKWRTYTMAMIPGCIAWALIYSFGLLAVWMSIAKAVTGSIWGWVGLALITAVILFGLWHRARHRSAVGNCPISPAIDLAPVEAPSDETTTQSRATAPVESY